MQIVIDYSKCISPLDCAKCLEICSEAVFIIKPMKVEKFKETSAGDYKLFPVYDSMCNGCTDCVKVCPVSAIEIKQLA
ncbi:MAG TPA: ferredoxin family protein [bacterium]